MSAGLFNQGYWARLEMAATNVGLAGKNVDGMRFTIVGNESTGGEVLWDHVGVKHGSTDTDGDGLVDWREVQFGTDINYPDTDYDGISDNQEVTDGTDPTEATDFTQRRLGYWKFNTSAFVGEQGQNWTTSSNVSCVSSWSSNALATATNLYSGLMYREYETNGAANINCRNGTVRLWLKPNWASTNQGGQGPGISSRLIELGYFAEPWVGHWAIGLTPEGTNLWFVANGTDTNSSTTISVPISWASNQWHQVALAYTPSNSVLYLDGQPMNTNVTGIVLLSASLRSAGFRVGFDANGAWSNSHFEELETFNYPLSSTTISNDYGCLDVDGDGLTNAQEAALGSNPRIKDTDGDGLDDGEEYLLGRNPNAAGVTADTNGVINLKVFTPMK
jgi:hypothetical protein